jgi:hypothetical protein
MPWREYPGQNNIAVPPDYQEKTEWILARLKYPPAAGFGRGFRRFGGNWTHQVPGARYLRSGLTWEQDGYATHWRGIHDYKRRLLAAICHDIDLGADWECADQPALDEKFSALALRIATNYIVYSMTH